MLYYTHYSCSYPTLSDHSFMVYVECERGLDLETFRNQYPEKAAEMFKDFELARCVGHNFHKMHFGGSHGDIKESNYLVVPLSSDQQHLLHLPNGDQKMIKDYKIVLMDFEHYQCANQVGHVLANPCTTLINILPQSVAGYALSTITQSDDSRNNAFVTMTGILGKHPLQAMGSISPPESVKSQIQSLWRFDENRYHGKLLLDKGLGDGAISNFYKGLVLAHDEGLSALKYISTRFRLTSIENGIVASEEYLEHCNKYSLLTGSEMKVIREHHLFQNLALLMLLWTQIHPAPYLRATPFELVQAMVLDGID